VFGMTNTWLADVLPEVLVLS
jgi:uncharacterized protein GlcG (DUF336 family)